MSWQACFPTKVYFGQRVIAEHRDLLSELGSRALIVTGQGGSAKRNGALEDVQEALKNASVSWELFDEIEPNPSVETVRKGAQMAQNMQADFVIGIGGGSALDAAKAIAITNLSELSEEDLFDLKYGEVLPLIAVPTTAGTGSEVTSASILTSKTYQTKKNIGSPRLLPRMAFLDPRYTYDLSWQITADTAVDAYSHALESYLSFNNTPISSLFSEQAMNILSKELKLIAQKRELKPKSREALLYGSYLAGLAISLTGTSIPHAIGYSLTYFKGLPHGRANGIIMPAWMEFNMKKSPGTRITAALKASSLQSLEEFSELMEALCGKAPVCSLEEKEHFLQQSLQTRNLYNNIAIPQREDVEKIIASCLS